MSSCCDRHSEKQPLLGHQNHFQSSAPRLQPQLPLQYQPVEHHIVIVDEKSSTWPSAPESAEEAKKSCKRRCGWLAWAFLFLVGYFIFLPHSRHHHSQSDNFNDLTLAEHYGDFCKKHAVEWDGPSKFSTTAKNFNLHFGSGNMGSHVQVKIGAVSEPTLLIGGKVSPLNEGEEHRVPAKSKDVAHGSEDEYSHLGLHIIIKEDNDNFGASLWFEDRYVRDEEHGGTYRACARLEVEVIFPESYTGYDTLSIDGNVLSLDTYSINKLGFQSVNFQSSVGDVSVHDAISADEFRVHVKTGAVSIESVGVATEGKALDVNVMSDTGSLTVGAEPSPVENNETHNIDISANTGAIKLDVHAPEALSVKNPGNLQISTRSKTGSVKNSIALSNFNQALLLRSESNVGTVTTTVSDWFLGHFNIETKLGSAKLQTAPGSKSKVSFEKSTSTVKTGSKTLENHDASKGRIELRSKVGGVSLKFDEF
ncbi:hypothetical protein BGX28_001046 [Mortierella sp. GBA30]|nr:hypothetical protein BGX28_001046 [Mortierella sp. GBA30]